MNGPYGFHILLLIQVLVLILLLPGTRAVSFFGDRKEDCEEVELNFIPERALAHVRVSGVMGGRENLPHFPVFVFLLFFLGGTVSFFIILFLHKYLVI